MSFTPTPPERYASISIPQPYPRENIHISFEYDDAMPGHVLIGTHQPINEYCTLIDIRDFRDQLTRVIESIESDH